MTESEQALETRVALAELAVSQIGDDVAFIRGKMEVMETMMTNLIRIDERLTTHATDISRAFDAIRGNQNAIDGVRSNLQAEKEKTDRWINAAVGIWVSASVLWILFGGAILWWVAKLNEHVRV